MLLTAALPGRGNRLETELSLSVDSRLSRGYKAFAGLQRDEFFQSTGTSRMASAAFLGRRSLIPTQRHLFAPVTVVFPTGCMWCCPWFLRALCYLAWRCSLTQMGVTRCPCPAAQFLPQRFFFPKKCCGLFVCFGFCFYSLCFLPNTSKSSKSEKCILFDFFLPQYLPDSMFLTGCI